MISHIKKNPQSNRNEDEIKRNEKNKENKLPKNLILN